VWDLHSKMVLELNKKLTPSKDETLNQRWRQFTQMLRRPDMLSDGEVGDLKDIFDVFKHLMDKGKIDYGRYDTVKRILERLDMIQCSNIITEFEENIEDVKQGKTISIVHSYKIFKMHYLLYL